MTYSSKFQSGKIPECTVCLWCQGIPQKLLNSVFVYYLIKGFQKHEMNRNYHDGVLRTKLDTAEKGCPNWLLYFAGMLKKSQ